MTLHVISEKLAEFAKVASSRACSAAAALSSATHKQSEQLPTNELGQRITRAIAALRGVEPEAVPTTVKQPRQLVMEAYSIKVLERGKVSFIIPTGKSRFDLLQDSQSICQELHGQIGVCQELMAVWAYDSNVATPVNKPTSFSIEGNVAGSLDKTRREQEEQGCNNVNFVDLACAHQAYLLATGRSFLCGDMVRASDGTLAFGSEGLISFRSLNVDRYSFIAASRSLSPSA